MRDVVLSVDGQPIEMTVTRAEGASLEEISAGAGTIRVEALGTIRAMSAGRHQIRLMNTHHPGFSVHLVNALVPANPAITIAAPRRDVLQRSIELDVDIASVYATTWWSVLMFGAIAALVTYRLRPHFLSFATQSSRRLAFSRGNTIWSLDETS